MIGAKPGQGLKDGDDDPPPPETKTVYALAGSLVEFLIENPIEDELLTKKNFGALYSSTPLRPFERGCGTRARWQSHYQGKAKSYSFTDLGLLWKTYMHVELVGAGKKIPEDFEKMPLVSKLAKRLRRDACSGRSDNIITTPSLLPKTTFNQTGSRPYNRGWIG